MKKISLLILSMISLVMGLSSCGTKSGSFISNTDTLVYEQKSVVVVSALDSARVQDDRSFARIQFPYFVDEDESMGLNTFILQQLTKDSRYNSFEEVCKGFISEYDSSITEDHTQTWEKDVYIKVLMQHYPIVALSVYSYEYTGGAHGNYGTTFLNYNCKTQSRIELKNLFNNDELLELTKIAEQIFRKQEGLGKNDDYSNYFFDNGQFTLPGNFCIKKDGLLFQYGIYEIKPYVAGTTDLFVPYETIKQLIKKDNLLMYVLGTAV